MRQCRRPPCEERALLAAGVRDDERAKGDGRVGRRDDHGLDDRGAGNTHELARIKGVHAGCETDHVKVLRLRERRVSTTGRMVYLEVWKLSSAFGSFASKAVNDIHAAFAASDARHSGVFRAIIVVEPFDRSNAIVRRLNGAFAWSR